MKPAAGDPTVLRKIDGAWRIVQPLESAADETEATGIVTNLASLEVQRVVDENPRDLTQYGLAQPRVDVGFKSAGDKDEHHLLIGDKTATGGDLYAKLPNEKRVFLVSAFLDTTFNRTTFDLRDKSVLKFERDKVDSVVLASIDKGGDVQLAKTGDEWSLTRPIEAPADFGTVEGLIGRLQTLQMKSIVASRSEGPEEVRPRQAGRLGDDRRRQRAGDIADRQEVGRRDAVRARCVAPDGVHHRGGPARRIEEAVRRLPPQGPVRVRGPYNATRLEVTRGSETWTFEKVKGEGKDATDKWRQVSPAARDVDATKLDALLTKLTNMRAQSWVAAGTKTGTDQPVLAVGTRFDDGKKQERVVFGKAGSDVYASRTGEPGAAKVDPVEFDDAMKALDALK